MDKNCTICFNEIEKEDEDVKGQHKCYGCSALYCKDCLISLCQTNRSRDKTCSVCNQHKHLYRNLLMVNLINENPDKEDEELYDCFMGLTYINLHTDYYYNTARPTASGVRITPPPGNIEVNGNEIRQLDEFARELRDQTNTQMLREYAEIMNNRFISNWCYGYYTPVHLEIQRQNINNNYRRWSANRCTTLRRLNRRQVRSVNIDMLIRYKIVYNPRNNMFEYMEVFNAGELFVYPLYTDRVNL